MKFLKRVWNIASWTASGMLIYRQLKALNEGKNELYQSLSPEQQSEWEHIFGKPDLSIQPISIPTVQVPTKASTIEQVQAGT